ncbi:addiction module toxin, RelE/StbE family [[Eubacterium] yurii subsp. margaretiae ATCC 43715]|nr:addiction module toxin, RelE/StbE family [[Eubacterium] yurii subsp. margaretiae ATCC 43715]
MYKLKFTKAYKKSYKRIVKRGLDISLLEDVIDMLRQGIKLDLVYNDHILKGELAGFHECHIKPDCLLIYLIEDDILTLTLVDTVSHADLFKL